MDETKSTELVPSHETTRGLSPIPVEGVREVAGPDVPAGTGFRWVPAEKLRARRFPEANEAVVTERALQSDSVC
jgi:hypothetical protein